MYQKKYSPEESLQRIKLMMGYSLNKTLKENAQTTGVLLSEQNIDYNSPEYKLARELWTAVSGPGTNEGNFVSAVVRIESKDMFNKIDNFLKNTFASKLSFAEWVNDDFGTDDANSIKSIVKHLSSIGVPASAEFDDKGNFIEDSFKLVAANNEPTSKVKDKKDGLSKKTYGPCPQGDYKRGCNSEVVKKVQACLGMATKYQTGNFGAITQGELKKLGKGFENGFKDADVEVICTKKQQPEKPSGVEELEPNNTASQNEPF